MRDYLLFRLYGPMAAWGDIAVGEHRPSLSHPSKSAVLGLLAAALGLRRDDEAGHEALAMHYAMAVCVDAGGELMRDYHTTQVPPRQRGIRYATRRDELAAERLNTILSQRDYRMDAAYRIALWPRGDDAPYTLDQLAQALAEPRFVLYLGRKACPPALPLAPRSVSAVTLREAFDALLSDHALPDGLYSEEKPMVYWEDLSAAEAGFPETALRMQYTRRDRVLSRRRWQFVERQEYAASLSREKTP